MLPVNNRLKKVRDFNLLIKYGKYLSHDFLSLKYLSLSDIKDHIPLKEPADIFFKQLKIAFAISLKVSKSAVKRNRLKRKMREVVRLLIQKDKLKIGYYILLTTKKEALDKEFTKLSSEIEILFQKAKILC